MKVGAWTAPHFVHLRYDRCRECDFDMPSQLLLIALPVYGYFAIPWTDLPTPELLERHLQDELQVGCYIWLTRSLKSTGVLLENP